MADIPAGTLMHRASGMGIGLPEGSALAAWRRRLAQRGGYVRHVLRPFGELFGRTAF